MKDKKLKLLYAQMGEYFTNKEKPRDEVYDRLRKKIYYYENKTAVLERVKNYNAENKTEHAMIQKKYYSKNKPILLFISWFNRRIDCKDTCIRKQHSQVLIDGELVSSDILKQLFKSNKPFIVTIKGKQYKLDRIHKKISDWVQI